MKLIQNLVVALKGFFMGAANVVPGVSGGTIALITGIYKEIIDALKPLTHKEDVPYMEYVHDGPDSAVEFHGVELVFKLLDREVGLGKQLHFERQERGRSGNRAAEILDGELHHA